VRAALKGRSPASLPASERPGRTLEHALEAAAFVLWGNAQTPERFCFEVKSPQTVMGGLDPPIQLPARQREKLDGRVKPGHDEGWSE
jgi:hypothetical protein